MTPIVFKMRHTDPRTKRRSTPQRNSSHIKYIGEREHALIAEKNTEHIRYIGEREHAALTQHNNGLFGKIRGEYSNSYATTDVQNYVRSMSTAHRNIYWSVYSFKPETAAEAGLHTLTDWENWVKQRIYEISDHLKIRYDDLEYIAAVHLKDGQPHVHIGFWDKEQQIYRKTVSPVICDRIRIDAIKHTFRDKFNELHNKEDRLIKEMRQQTAQEISGGRIFQITKGYLHNEMTRGANAAGVKRIRIHDLRHSHVSLLIDMGYSAVAIGERVGHESADITYHYAHLFPSVQTDMANDLNNIKLGGDADVSEKP